MRYLGIDYGAKRIGLALSDENGRMAFPLKTVGSVEEVRKAAAEHSVGALVIGLPRALDGADTDSTRAARAFAAKLAQSVQLPIVFEDELYTTKIAEANSPPELADAAAAALILQSYLDRIGAGG